MPWHHIALSTPLEVGQKTAKEIIPLHGARFDLRDGCPTSGPATKPLATYPVELRNGKLYVSL